MAKGYYSVGEMAKKNGLTTQTLRFYDKINLFKPSYINPKTSYRYYTADQFDKLLMINYLRSLEMSLDEIKEYFNNDSDLSLVDFFQKELKKTRDKIETFRSIEKRLEEEILIAKNQKKFNKVDTHYFKDRLIDFNVLNSANLQEIHESFNLLTERNSNIKNKRYGSIISQKGLEKGKMQFHSAFIFLQDSCPLETIPCMLSEGEYACIVASGNREDREESMKLLLKWVHDNDYEIIGDAILIMLSHNHGRSNRMLYELQIPIKGKECLSQNV